MSFIDLWVLSMSIVLLFFSCYAYSISVEALNKTKNK
jgi:hypothetical protein